MNRREFSQHLCGAALSAAFAKMAVAQQQTHSTHGMQQPKPEKPEEIAMLIYGHWRWGVLQNPAGAERRAAPDYCPNSDAS